MNIEPGTGPVFFLCHVCFFLVRHIGPALRATKIILVRDFVIVGCASNTDNIKSGCFKQGRIIGKFLALEFLMGIQNGFKRKPLWCLRPLEAFTRNSSGYDAAAVCLFDGICNGQGGDRPGMGRKGCDNPFDYIIRNARSGGIMDQNNIRTLMCKARKPFKTDC